VLWQVNADGSARLGRRIGAATWRKWLLRAFLAGCAFFGGVRCAAAQVVCAAGETLCADASCCTAEESCVPIPSGGAQCEPAASTACGPGRCPAGTTCFGEEACCWPLNNPCCILGEIACGLACCRAGEICTEGTCVPVGGSLCSNGLYTFSCDPTQTCIDGSCCPGPQSCGTGCCGPSQVCSNGACCNPDQTGTAGSCCPSDLACGSTCCAEGQTCSNGLCCPAGEVGSNGVCCSPGETGCSGQCCPSGQACTQPETVGGGWQCCPAAMVTPHAFCCSADYPCPNLTAPGGGLCSATVFKYVLFGPQVCPAGSGTTFGADCCTTCKIVSIACSGTCLAFALTDPEFYSVCADQCTASNLGCRGLCLAQGDACP
jgi:hypothetical protein